MKTCSNCGQELNDEMDFCPNCGNQVNGEFSQEGEDSYYEEDEKPWYQTDIFNIAITPLVRSFDNGKFFLEIAKDCIYFFITVYLLTQPYQAFRTYWDSELASLSTADKAVELSYAVIMLIIAIFGFGYWRKRARKLDTIFHSTDDFVVIPLGSYLFQWIGEWIAILLGVGGIFAMIISLFDIRTTSYTLNFISHYGWTGGILAIMLSIIIVFVFRLLAEKIRALAAIANNTSKKESSIIPDIEEEDETNDLGFNLLYAVCIVVTVGYMLAAFFE